MNSVYLAYGSNLNLEQMNIRCPNAAVIGSATLCDYLLTFRGSSSRGVATIEPKKGSAVPVLVWEITKECERALDRYEGFPRLYRKEVLPVHLDGMRVQAMVYIMNPIYPYAVPDAYYYTTILEGYRDCGFDEEILNTAVSQTASHTGHWQT